MTNARTTTPGTRLRTFCEEAARQMRGLETRLRTIAAGSAPHPEVVLLEEAVASSLQIAATLLDAGQRGQHERLLALRPILRALAPPRGEGLRAAAPRARLTDG